MTSVRYEFIMSQVKTIRDIKETEKVKISLIFYEGAQSTCILKICKNRDLSEVQKTLELPQQVEAPVKEGDVAGYAVYSLNGTELGKTEIVYTESMKKATFMDYFKKAFEDMLF